MAEQILIVDDETNAVDNLTHVCNKAGYEVTSTTSGQEALELIRNQTFDLVLTDLRIDQVDGIEILNLTKELHPETEVILITGYASFETAVDAMKAGAFHYIAKPFQLDEVRELIRKALSVSQLKTENRQLRKQLTARNKEPKIITQDSVMKGLLDTARQVATTMSNVLITGESGTGKELMARYIHAHSNRKEQGFFAINCAALPEELLASELFGHEKGAFTGATDRRAGLFEAAKGGTVFLDEVGEMSPSMQVKLLRVIQEREVQRLGSNATTSIDIRLVAATNRDLQQEVNAGRFRQDLFYRLNVIELHLPPLSHRKNDIPLLARYFLQQQNSRNQSQIKKFSAEAMDTLTRYPYPGNIRELNNAIEHCAALAQGNEIQLNELPSSMQQSDQPLPPQLPVTSNLPSLADRESEYIEFVMDFCDGNRTQAASILGIDRVSLWRRLKSKTSE